MAIREDLYLKGLDICLRFLAHNNINPPLYVAKSLTSTGLYTGRHIYVNVPSTTTPVPKPYHMRWSWPGWKTDRTAIGVLAHETGHHVDQGRSLRQTWRQVCGHGTKKVSGYEPSAGEAWAESLRLFILNPELLKAGIPGRYAAVVELGIKPLPERVTLGIAGCVDNNPHYIAAAETWIAK
jgi:hypothetical protein